MDKASISVRYGKGANLEKYFANIINSRSGEEEEEGRRKGGVGRMMWRSSKEMKTNQKMHFKL